MIKTEAGVEKERYPAIYGATMFFKENDEIAVGEKLMEWDPFAIPILCEVSGTVKYEDLVQGNTLVEQMDSVTGIAQKIVAEAKDGGLQPRIVICDKNGDPIIVPGTKRTASTCCSVYWSP